MANVIHSTLTYNANLGPAQAQIKALTGQIGALTAAFNTLDKAALKTQASLASTFMANVGQIGGFTSQIVKSSTAVDQFGQAVAKQRLTMRQYFREAFAGYTKQNSMMKQLAAQQVRMQQSMVVPMGMGAGGAGQAAVLTPTHLNAMANKAALASAKFSIFNELVQGGSTRLLNFGKNTQWTGRQLMVGFTLPLIMFTAVVSKQFREIDKELTRFEKVYGADLVDTVDSSTKKMREQVKQLAFEISSAYGIAAKDTAALAADIAATGKEGQALLDSVKQTTRLAVLGEVERQEAMRATLSIQNAFKLNTLELAESIDFLNAVENQTSTNLQDLAGAIPRVGPVIQSLGGDIKDMSLLLVAMREGGVSAAEGANALKSGLGRLINPTRAARDMAASFGISLQSIIDSSRGELLPMIFGLQDALNGLDDFAKAQVIEKIFGKYQFARMSALFANLRRQGSQTLTVMELASASSTELAGIANQELRDLQESTSMRFQRTIENLKNSLVPLGEMLTETMIPILSAIGGGIKSFLEFFQSLPEPVKNFTKYAVTLTALAGPVVMLVGLFGNLIANGIKFSMMIVRLGAKIGGLRFEKFELLTADTIAAKTGVDNLTQSFTTQEAALKRLTGVMSAYEASLRRLTTTNPALFIPGAVPGRGVAPIRRSKGSRSPETVPGGYGGGDVVPALLEPGEFVVRKEAAAKNKNFLRALNRGQVRGYAFGDEVRPMPADGYSAPTTIRESLIHPAQQARMAEVIDEIARRAGVVFANERQRNDAVRIHLTHLEKDMRGGVKYFDPANLLLASGAENQALEQLTGQGKTARRTVIALMNEFAANDPEIRRVRDSLFSRDSSGNVTDIRQPRTREQMALFSRVLDRMLQSPNDKSIWGRSAAAKTVWAPLFKAILDERRAGGGRLLPSEIPMARDVARAIMGAGLTESERAAAARASISGAGRTTPGGEAPPAMRRPVGAGPRPPVFLGMPGRGAVPIRVQPGEAIIPPRFFADNGAIVNRDGSITPLKIAPADPRSPLMQRLAARGGRGSGGTGIIPSGTGAYGTGPQDNLSRAQAAAPGAMKGMGLMNIAFASSMIVSSMSMAGGASNDLAIKLGLLSGAVMTAAAMMQMFAGKNVMGNFLGLGSAGSKMTSAGVAAQRAAITQHGSAAAARAAGAGGAGASLLRGGAALSMLGGPVGIGVAAALTAGVAGYMMYMKAAEQARERAVAAFADPAKTAEYFGIAVSDVTEKLKAVSAQAVGVEEVDQALRDAVKQDYGTLIQKIQYGGAEAGGRELGIVFNKMIASGLSEEQAKDAIKAIAIESGTVGGQAYAQALREGMLSAQTPEQIARSTAQMFDPEKQKESIETAKRTLAEAEQSVGQMGRLINTSAMAIDNWVGTTLVNLVPIVTVPMGIEFDTVAARDAISKAAEVERQMHQMQTGIQEMSDVTGDQIVKVTEILFQNFEKAPEETIQAFDEIVAAGKRASEEAFDTQPIKDFISEIDPIGSIILNAIIGDDEDIAMAVQRAIISGMSVSEIIDALNTGGLPALEIEVDLQVRDAEITAEINRLKGELQEDLVMELDLKIEKEEEQLEGVNKQLERMDKFRARHEGVLKKAMNRLNRQSEAAIEGMQSEIDLIRERSDARREDFDERMDELNEEKEQINESADAYIDSIRKRERADSFYSQQRKTAFSALQKLAAGDVFGFLQEREQMSADAQTFAYENTIQDIEDKRDREVDAIDQVIEKEQDRQEKYERNVEKRIDLINDQIDAEQELMDQRQKDFDKQMRFFDRREKRRRTDLENEKKELEISLADLRSTRDMAESGVLVDQKRLSDALGKERARPYFEEQKAIVKTEMMKKYLEMKDKHPTESPAQLQMRAHGELIDLFNALYGVAPGAGRRPTMGWAQQLEDIGFTPEFNTGGHVRGPGTPTSDSIPARLSDGEYVVRASSVKKYGTDLMDAINVGKFRTGGYVSADRAETAANNNVYAGGWKPKPAYSGGTPTSSTGYSTANTQASANIYGKGKNKSPFIRGGGAYRGWGGGRAGAGFSAMGSAISQSIGQKGIWGTLSAMASGIIEDPASLIPFYGLSSFDTSTQQGKDMQQAAALLEILGVIPGVGIPFKGLSIAGRTGTKAAVSAASSPVVPPSSLGNLFSLDMGLRRSAVAAASPVKPTVAKGPLGDSVLLEWVRRYVDEDALDNVFDKVVAGSQGGISPGGWVIGKDGVRRYVKGQYDSHSGARSVYLEALIANAYDSLGMNVPKINLLNVGQNPRPFPGNPTVDMAPGSIIPADEFLRRAPWTNYTPGQLITSSEMLDNVRHVSGFFGRVPDTGNRTLDTAGKPIGLTFAEQQFDKSMRATLAKEGGIGKAVDTLFGLRDTHYGNYVIREDPSIPLGVPERFNPYRIDFGSNAFQTPGGRPLPFDPSDPLKISNPQYGNTYGFGAVRDSQYRDQVYKLQEIIGDMGGIGGLIDPILFKFADSAPQYKLTNPDFLKFVLRERLRAMVSDVRKYKDGGLVQGFSDGGLATRSSASGPNSWVHLSPGSPLLATGKVPGTSKTLTTRKEVLPLFLAIASEYHKKIRDIQNSQTGAYDPRSDRPHEERMKSNHPSGTALDINWTDEGRQSDVPYIHQWWSGRPTPAAPWKSKSSNPARTAVQIRDYFNKFGEIIEWYGSSKLGGDLIWGAGNTSDWMHWQISQSTKPSPSRVLEVMKKLGLNADGTGASPGETSENPETGGKRPNSGANGTGAGGRYMPPIIAGGGNTQFGKASPRWISAWELPGSDTTKPDRPDSDKPGNGNQDGSYNNRYIRGAQLVKLLDSVGFKGADLRTAFGVVMGESSGDRRAVNNNGTNKDWGLFQMNDYWNRNIVVDGKKADFSPDKIFDAQYNSRFALATTRDAGVRAHWKDPWRDWNAYNHNTRWYQNGLKLFDQNPQWRTAIGLSSGGMIRGAGSSMSDSIPAMLSNGEYVIRADSVKKYGKDFLDAVNSGRFSPEAGMSQTPIVSIQGVMPQDGEVVAMKFGGMVGKSRRRPTMPGRVAAKMPAFNLPSTGGYDAKVGAAAVYSSERNTVNNSNNVRIVINGAGKNAKSIANKVAEMINSSNNARNHSRSI